MKPRTLDQLARGTEQYVHGAKSGRRNRLLAATLFSFNDTILESAHSEAAKAIAERIATETEAVVRLAHAPTSGDFYAAWQRQREAVAEARTVFAIDRTD